MGQYSGYRIVRQSDNVTVKVKPSLNQDFCQRSHSSSSFPGPRRSGPASWGRRGVPWPCGWVACSRPGRGPSWPRTAWSQFPHWGWSEISNNGVNFYHHSIWNDNLLHCTMTISHHLAGLYKALFSCSDVDWIVLCFVFDAFADIRGQKCFNGVYCLISHSKKNCVREKTFACKLLADVASFREKNYSIHWIQFSRIKRSGCVICLRYAIRHSPNMLKDTHNLLIYLQ